MASYRKIPEAVIVLTPQQYANFDRCESGSSFTKPSKPANVVELDKHLPQIEEII
jgi:hypothetical protein